MSIIAMIALFLAGCVFHIILTIVAINRGLIVQINRKMQIQGDEHLVYCYIAIKELEALSEMIEEAKKERHL